MNRLASEKSPYLLQHAQNPVDWYPWGEEAFAKARTENKPIFVSIGYSTCHWCHVMAHESFENHEVARVLNERFVPVKIDREERPDVDRVYMLFVQATTGSGGWPMSVWLTPDLRPFYGGTYFPPTSRWGRAGFIDILREIARVWRDEPQKVLGSAEHMTAQLQAFAAGRHSGDIVSAEPSRRSAVAHGSQSDVTQDFSPELQRETSELARAFDSRYAGFGGAPKFPRASELLFLFREFARTGDTKARDMALETLRAMARGGIHDHLGGGFHRYSVDARWHVPHFEKMLYDQAQLAISYVEGFQVSGDPDLARVAERILEYVERDLTSPGGGFYSAEDADSVPPGQPAAHPREGAFYTWTEEEVRAVAGEHAEAAVERYGVRPGGNADDALGELTGTNVLYLARTADELASRLGRPPEAVASAIAAATRDLFEARARRPRPGLDDKIIVAWNGLMIAAFARAARVLRGEAASAKWLQTARRAALFIRSEMWSDGEGRLLRRYRDGEAAISAYAEDYACLVFGLIEMFQADGDPSWLEWATALQERQNELFWDTSSGGWFSTDGRDPSVLIRLKEDYDGAEPAASSISLFNLIALSTLVGKEAIDPRIEEVVRAFAPQMRSAPRSLPMMLAAVCTLVSPSQEIVVVGPRGRDDCEALLGAIASRYLPFAVVIPIDTEAPSDTKPVLPLVAQMSMREGKATAYVCRDFACRQPVTEAQQLLKEIASTE